MEKVQKKNGISLIVLVITILVMIILAGVVVVTMSENNPIEKAKEANFVSNVGTFVEELELTHANNIAKDPNYKKTSVNVIKGAAGEDAHYADMKKHISSITKDFAKKFDIVKGNLVYTGTDKKEEGWLNGEVASGGNTPSTGNAVNPNKFVKDANANAYFMDSLQTQDGAVVYAMPTEATNVGAVPEGANGVVYMHIYKVDASGKEIWRKNIYLSLNTMYANMPLNLLELADGSIVVTGTDLGSPSPSNKMACLAVKLDKNGNVIWQKRYLDDAGDYILYGRVESMLAEDGNILIPGSSIANGICIPLVYKVNAQTGDVIWKSKMQEEYTGARKVMEDSRGYVVLAGNGTISLLDKATGDVTSSFGVDANNYAAYIDKVADGKYILANMDMASNKVQVLDVNLETHTVEPLVTGIQAKTYEGGYFTKYLADGSFVVVTDNVNVHRYSYPAGTLLGEKKFNNAADNPQGDSVIVNSVREEKGGKIRIVGMSTAPELFGKQYPQDKIYAFSIAVTKSLEEAK